MRFNTFRIKGKTIAKCLAYFADYMHVRLESRAIINVISLYFGNKNKNFFMNSVNLLTERPASISIRPIRLDDTRLQLNRTNTLVLIFVAVLIIPIATFATGVVVWFRRRSK